MPRTVLIVDDVAVNRRILSGMLKKDYSVLEACNGKEAVDILKVEHQKISALLLDISMPVMNGYEVLNIMRKTPELAQIPVIVTTGSETLEAEKKALTLGANDFVIKPFDIDILKHRLDNLIRFRESATIINTYQKDKLTGLWSREAFFERAAKEIKKKPGNTFVLSCLDVDNFKVVNDQYGTKVGDKVLKNIARALKKECEHDGNLCGRISGDNFAVLYSVGSLSKKSIEKYSYGVVRYNSLPFPITISTGRYFVSDKTLPVSTMYDRAKIAQATIKGRSDIHVAVYDESMRSRIIRRQEIVNEMHTALAEGQFEPWYQPQYNHATGAVIGAEALVRWRHPVHGLVPPNDFIPLFEQNGFVYNLDKYIIEQVCIFLKKRIDSGKVSLPVSVNVSRYDILRADFVPFISNLIKQYSLPIDLLRLEITESAFAKDLDKILAVVDRLIGLGFILEIDDFGSGYSSLNTLKDVPATILKLDMRFFETTRNSRRAGNIIESIVRMAKWLGMSVIAEGVEEKAQADYLKSVGCFYIQGYYYARPMPIWEYENLLDGSQKESKLNELTVLDNLDKNEFWNPKSLETLIFNSYVGGACIVEIFNGKEEMLRMNDQYLRELGSLVTQGSTLKQAYLSRFLDDENKAVVIKMLKQAENQNREASCEVMLTDGKNTEYVRITVRLLAKNVDRKMFYCVIQSLTAQRKAELRELDLSKRLQSIMANVDSGICAAVSENGKPHLLFANEMFYTQCGYTKSEFELRFNDNLDIVFPEDAEIVLSNMQMVISTGVSACIDFRIKRADGKIRWIRVRVSRSTYPGVDTPVILSVSSDITESEKTQRDILDNMPCGAGIYSFTEGQMSLVYQNKSYWELVGLSDISYPDPSAMSAVHPEDIPVIMQALALAFQQHSDVNCDIRLRHLTKGYLSVHLSGRIVPDQKGGFYIYTTFTPYTEMA